MIRRSKAPINSVTLVQAKFKNLSCCQETVIKNTLIQLKSCYKKLQFSFEVLTDKATILLIQIMLFSLTSLHLGSYIKCRKAYNWFMPLCWGSLTYILRFQCVYKILNCVLWDNITEIISITIVLWEFSVSLGK